MKIIILTLLVSSFVFAFPKTPNSKFTHAHFCTDKDRDFDGYRYAEKIPHCKRRVYTSTRKKVYAMYGIAWADRSQYTIDHLVSLAFSGSNDISNLWPQHKSISSAKYEGQLYRLLKAGKITRNEAVNLILKFKYGK